VIRKRTPARAKEPEEFLHRRRFRIRLCRHEWDCRCPLRRDIFDRLNTKNGDVRRGREVVQMLRVFVIAQARMPLAVDKFAVDNSGGPSLCGRVRVTPADHKPAAYM
jgi:hypothetical protein